MQSEVRDAMAIPTFSNSPGSYIFRYIGPKSDNKSDRPTPKGDLFEKEPNVTQERDADSLAVFDTSDEDRARTDPASEYKNQEESAENPPQENSPGRTLQRQLTNVVSRIHVGHTSHLCNNTITCVVEEVQSRT